MADMIHTKTSNRKKSMAGSGNLFPVFSMKFKNLLKRPVLSLLTSSFLTSLFSFSTVYDFDFHLISDGENNTFEHLCNTKNRIA